MSSKADKKAVLQLCEIGPMAGLGKTAASRWKMKFGKNFVQPCGNLKRSIGGTYPVYNQREVAEFLVKHGMTTKTVEEMMQFDPATLEKKQKLLPPPPKGLDAELVRSFLTRR